MTAAANAPTESTAGSGARRIRRLVIYSPDAFQSATHCHDYVEGLGTALARLGVDVVVVGWDGPLTHSAPLREERVARSAAVSWERPVYRRMLGALGDVTWGLDRIRTERKLLARVGMLLNGTHDSAVLFESFEYIALSRFLRRDQRRYPRACIFHDTNFNLRHASPLAAAYKYLCRRVVRQIIEQVDVAFVHGRAMRENLIANVRPAPRPAGRVTAIPYGSPHPDGVQRVERRCAREMLDIPPHRKLMLAFGTLRRDKRFDVILHGLARLPHWHILIAGPEGDLTYDAVQGLAEGAGVRERVRIDRGFISADRHALYFGAADVVVSVYHESTRHESGTAQLARSFLRPVLVGGGPDLREYVETTGVGWAIDVRDPTSVAHVLEEAERCGGLHSPELEARIYACAAERSWAAVARDFLARFSGARSLGPVGASIGLTTRANDADNAGADLHGRAGE